MSGKMVYVMEEEWDYLIILDACRYDYFTSIYSEYFDGELEKRTSPGSSTLEWATESFKKYYPEVVYVSGNPFINSKVDVKGFDAKKHFYRVIDVWDLYWDEELGTVPPWSINKAALSSSLKMPGKRFIIHYLQPHAPYLSSRFRTSGFPNPNPRYGQILTGIQGCIKNKYLEAFVSITGDLLVKARIISHAWKLREWLGLPPTSPMDAVRRKYGVEGLRQAYRENLKIVLWHAAKLCRELLKYAPSKRVVITSDHGELLGENGKYSHGIWDPHVLEVPLLRVRSVRKTIKEDVYMPDLQIGTYKEKLRKRIKRLKKMDKLRV